jgi:hypothetical protein
VGLGYGGNVLYGVLYKSALPAIQNRGSCYTLWREVLYMPRVLVAIRFPEELKRFMDEESAKRGVTLTSFIVNACWRDLEEPRDSSVAEQTAHNRPAAGSSPAPSSKLSAALSVPGVSLGMPAKTLDTHCVVETVSERKPCAYTEYDEQTGETYGCRLMEHSAKVKHQRGAAL